MPALDRARTIQAAEKFVKAGKLIEAVKEYQKLADDNPRDMNVVNKLGDLLVRAGRNAEALKHFVRIADFYARDGFFLKAIAMYKKVTKLDPANVESQQRLAAMYSQQGLASDAKAQYAQLAEQLIRQNQAPAAADALRRVLEIEPDNTRSRLSLAEVLVRSGKGDEAAREYCLVARAAAVRGELAGAVEAARRGVEANPGLPGLAGLLLSMVTRLQAAPAPLVTAVEQMAQSAGRSAMALLVLGETLRRAGRASEADEVMRRLTAGVETDDDLDAEALAVLARHHDAHHRPTEAWDALDRAIARAEPGAGPDPATLLDEFIGRHPDHHQALSLRAEIAARAGDAASEAAALRGLAPSLMAKGETGRAAEVVMRLTTLLPGDADVARLQNEMAGGGKPSVPAGLPSPPVVADDEDEVEVVLIESDEPAGLDRAAAESESAEEIFNLEEDGATTETDREAVGTAPVPETPMDAPVSEEEAYGPGSRIQEIQSTDATGLPIDEDFISEHLTEAEVFVKYGLHGKAREQLQSILERYPDQDTARIRLKDILVTEGNTEGAIRECLAIADILRSKGSEAESREMINEAVRLNPESPLVERHRSSVDLRPAEKAPAIARRGAAAATAAVAAAIADPLAIEEPDAATSGAGGVEPTAGEATASVDGHDWLSADRSIEIEVAGAGSDEERDFAATTAQTVLPTPGERIEEDAPDELPRAVPAHKKDGPAPAAEVLAAEPAATAIGMGGSDSIADLISGLDDTAGAPTLVGAPTRDPDDEKLGEVDFYVEQGLVDEARQVLFQLGKQYPGSEAVALRLQRLDRPEDVPAPVAADPGSDDLDFEVEQALTGKSARIDPKPRAKPASKQPAPAPRAAHARAVFKMEKHADNGGGDFVDLGAELSRTLSEETTREPAISETLDGQAHSFDDIFAAFKKGVEQQVESDDFETHYNLGIAYKEMGLVDEAIGELQFAARDPSRTLECCGILGLCFRDKGMPDLALKWYKRGLDMPGLDEGHSLGLRYDMGEVYREKGEYDEALKAYTEVYGVDSTYRDVSARIKEIQSQRGASKR